MTRMVRIGVALACAAVVSGCARMFQGPARQAQRDAVIFLWQEPGSGDCKAKTWPYRLPASRGNADRVTWFILDPFTCTADREISIRFNKGDADPFEPCVNTGKDRISCIVSGSAAIGPHRYSVWLGADMEEDPEIQIEH